MLTKPTEGEEDKKSEKGGKLKESMMSSTKKPINILTSIPRWNSVSSFSGRIDLISNALRIN